MASGRRAGGCLTTWVWLAVLKKGQEFHSHYFFQGGYKMMRTFKLKAGNDLGNLASTHFDGVEIPVRLTDLGASDEETAENILRSAGSWQNARNIFVSGGEALARQKDLKELAKELAPKIEEGALTREEAIQQLIDRGARETAPEVTVRGEGTGTRKPAAKTVEKVKAQIAADADAKLADMSDEERAVAEALLAKLGLK